MSPIRIRVNGKPAPQGSKKNVGGGRMVESSKALKPWRDDIRAETQRVIEAGATPFAMKVPITCIADFYISRPLSHYSARGGLKASAPTRPAGVPDTDKLARAILDGMAAGGAFHNDSQVVDLFASKWYADADHLPGVEVALHNAIELAS